MAVAKTYKKSAGIEIPEGSHVGLFMGLTHVGVHKSDFNGEIKFKDQAILKFELPDITSDDGRPLSLVKRVTNSMDSRAVMTKAVMAMTGGKGVDDGVDFEELLGKPLMLEVKKNAKKTGVNIEGFMQIPKIMLASIKPPMGTMVNFFDVEHISDEDLAELPEWLSKLINERIVGDVPVNNDSDY